MWVEPAATTKLLDYPHPHIKRNFVLNATLGRHALGMLGRALHTCETSTNFNS